MTAEPPGLLPFRRDADDGAVRRRRPGVPAAETYVQIGGAVFDSGVNVVEYGLPLRQHLAATICT